MKRTIIGWAAVTLLSVIGLVFVFGLLLASFAAGWYGVGR